MFDNRFSGPLSSPDRSLRSRILHAITTGLLCAGMTAAAEDPLHVAVRTTDSGAEGASATSAGLDVAASESAANATGAYSRLIPLRVPELFGIEPHLALAYHSRGGDGAAGVGWGLAGLSVIRRVAVNQGIPSFTPADLFALDGEELYPCPAAPLPVDLPGCKYRSGDPNHDHFFLRRQGGLRIVFDRTLTGDPGKPPGWIVWSQDGTRREYRARQITAGGKPAAWLLSSVTDASGSSVAYHYTPETDPHRYLTSIDYNGVLITVYWEDRPDRLPYALGDGTQAILRLRIKTIDVQTRSGPGPSGPGPVNRARTYALRYRSNAATSRSLLAELQEYGADATLDATGTVLGGTSLPPYRFEYGSEADYGHDPRPVSSPAPTVQVARGTPLPPADGSRGPLDQFSERLPAVLFWHGALSTVEGGHIQHASGDLDDDGQTDHIIAYFGSVTSFRVVGKLDDRQVVVPVSVTPPQYWNNKVMVADVNGDHRQDLLFVFCYDLGQPCRARALRYRTRTHDFLFLPEVVLPWGLPAGQPLNPRISVADVNGDGLADLVARPLLTGDFKPGSLWSVEVALGRGDGTFDSVRSLGILMPPSIDDQFLIADQDGDGRDDLILVGATATVFNPVTQVFDAAPGSKVLLCVATSRSEMATTAAPPFVVNCLATSLPTSRPGPLEERMYKQSWLTGDVNGDGRADVVRISRDRIEALLSKEELGDFDTVSKIDSSPATFQAVGGWQVRDVDRDGRADFVIAPYSYTPNGAVNPSSPPPGPMALHVILSRGIRGSTAVDFELRSTFAASPYYKTVPVVDRVSNLCALGMIAVWCPLTPLASADVADADGDGNLDVVGWSVVDQGPVGGCVDQPSVNRFCDHNVVWEEHVLALGSTGTEASRWIPADVNGDGRRDLVAAVGSFNVPPTVDTRLRQADGSFAATTVRSSLPFLLGPQNARVADVNGDGAEDLLWIEVTGSNVRIKSAVFESRGPANGVWKQLGKELSITLRASLQPAQRYFHIADVNGDGKSDVVYLEPSDGGLLWVVFISIGDGDFQGARGGAVIEVAGLVAGLKEGNVDWRPMDVNRDGATDFVGVWDQPGGILGIYTLIADREGSFLLPRVDQRPRTRAHNPRAWMVTDLTGDGIPDLFALHFSVQGSTIRTVVGEMLAGNGDGSWMSGEPLGPLSGAAAGTLSNWLAADMNGDGRTDLVAKSFRPGTAGASDGALVTTVYYSRNLGSDVLRLTSFGEEGSPNAPHPNVSTFQPSDRDEDTWSDLESLTWDEAAGAFALRAVVPTARFDYLTRMTYPLGGTISTAYGTFIDQDPVPIGGIGTFGAVCTAPPFAGHVVSSLSVNAETGPLVDGLERLGTVTRFAYHCGQWSPRRRQLIAFRAIDTSEEQLNRDPTTRVLSTAELLHRPARKTRLTFDASDECDARLLESREEDARVFIDAMKTRMIFPPPGGAPPYVCRATEVERTDPAVGGLAALTSLTTTHYDELVAPDLIVEHGDKAVPGDERLTRFTRQIQPVPYIVTVATEDVYAGERPDPLKKLRSSHYCYDRPLTFDNPDRRQATRATGCSPQALSRGLATAQLDCIDVGRCEDEAKDTLVLADGGTPNSYAWAASTFDYDAAGNRIAGLDPDGHGTRTTYLDPFPVHVFPQSVTDAAGDTTTRRWDYNLGVPIAVVDPSGAEARSVYDPLGRLVESKIVTQKDSAIEERFRTRLEYEFKGGPTSVTTSFVDDGSPRGLWQRFVVDGLGREIRRERVGSPDRLGKDRSFVQRTLYADASELPFQATPWFEAGAATVPFETFRYDYRGRLVKVTHADSSTITRKYSIESGTVPAPYDHQRTEVTDEEGHRRVDYQDVYGRTVRVDEPHLGTMVSTRYEWSADGALLAATDPAGDVIAFERDGLRRLRRLSDPDLGVIEYRYDPAGNQIASKDARGSEVLVDYDVRNQPAKVTRGGRTVIYTYGETTAAHGFGRGRLTSIIDSAVGCALDGDGVNRATSLEYDSLGHVVTHRKCLASGVSSVMRWNYDDLGRVAAITYPDGEKVSLKYDSGGELERLVNDSVSPSIVYVDRIVYDESTRPSEITLGNQVEEVYDYDANRRWLSHLAITDAKSRAIFDAGYKYQLDRQLEHVDVKGLRSWSADYVYDAQHRLTKAGAETFDYDLLGNLKTRNGVSYSYPTPTPGARQVHAVSRLGTAETFTYDEVGNLQTHSTPAGKRAYTWDAENRLTKVELGADTTTMAYDSEGTRIEKTAPDGTTTYSFSPYLEIDKSGLLVKYYRIGSRTVARRDGRGTASPLVFLHQNHLGSTIAVTAGNGPDAGIAVPGSDYLYEAFGAQADVTRNPAIARNVLFTQKRQAPETSPDAGAGLMDLGARAYDPRAARFLSADTAITGRGVLGSNRYAYAAQNPLFFSDPTGHREEPAQLDGGSESGGGILVSADADMAWFPPEQSVIRETAPPKALGQRLSDDLENLAFDNLVAPALLMVNTFILGQGLQSSMEAINTLRPHHDLAGIDEAAVFLGSLLVPLPSAGAGKAARLSSRSVRLGSAAARMGARRGSPEWLLQAAHELHARMAMNAAGEATGQVGRWTVAVGETAEGRIVAAVNQGQWSKQAMEAAEALEIELLSPAVNIPKGNWVHAETQLATQNIVRFEATRPMCAICVESSGLAGKSTFTGVKP